MGIYKLSSSELLTTILIFFFVFSSHCFSQDNNVNKYQYISPVPGSSMILSETSIIIRSGDLINPGTLSSGKFKLTGSKSGVHSYRIKLADDNKTILITPVSKFRLGEEVDVYYSDGILNDDGVGLPGFYFQFKITETDPSINYKRSINEIMDLEGEERLQIPERRIETVNNKVLMILHLIFQQSKSKIQIILQPDIILLHHFIILHG